jgi:transposase
VRRADTIAKRIENIKTELPLTSDKAIIEPSKLVVASLLLQLRATVAGTQQLDEEIEKLCTKLPDHKIFAALPGAGKVLSARLLAAFGEQRERFPTAAALQMYVGVAPVTVRSGASHRVHWRWACPKFQRQTFIEWTAQTIPKSFWAKTFYEKQKERGVSHNAAIRALAFKWIRVLWRCWVEQTPYDESRYLGVLLKRHSPLLNFEAQTPN